MRLTDAIGRYVAYTYDKKGYISAITDQNNKRYTENIYAAA